MVRGQELTGGQYASVAFFATFARHDCLPVAIENPVGIMSSLWRKPTR